MKIEEKILNCDCNAFWNIFPKDSQMVWQDFNMKLFMLSKSHLYFHALNCKLSFSFLVGFVFSRLFTYLEPAAGIWLIYHLSNLHPPKNTQTNLNFFIFFLYVWKSVSTARLNSNLGEFHQTKRSFLLWRRFLLYCPHKSQWGHPSWQTKIQNGKLGSECQVKQRLRKG